MFNQSEILGLVHILIYSFISP